MDKGSGSGSGTFLDPDPGDPKRRDPTGSGSATLAQNYTSALDAFLDLLEQEQPDNQRI